MERNLVIDGLGLLFYCVEQHPSIDSSKKVEFDHDYTYEIIRTKREGGGGQEDER